MYDGLPLCPQPLQVQCYECQNVLRLNLFPLHEKASALKVPPGVGFVGFVASWWQQCVLDVLADGK